MKLFRCRLGWFLAVLVWLGLMALGYSKLLHYTFAAGGLAPAPRQLPAGLKAVPESSRFQLFLALHPRCPCSRATVRELGHILTRTSDAVDVTALVYVPPGAPKDWLQNAMLDDCRRLKCQVRQDPEGKLAAALGSLTSGTATLYDGKGRLRYRGGITASRGHEGDNLGRRAIVEILTGARESFSNMPVFGCPIQEQTPRLSATTSAL